MYVYVYIYIYVHINVQRTLFRSPPGQTWSRTGGVDRSFLCLADSCSAKQRPFDEIGRRSVLSLFGRFLFGQTEPLRRDQQAAADAIIFIT